MGFRIVTADEKAEAIRLVVELNYSVPKACEQTGWSRRRCVAGFQGVRPRRLVFSGLWRNHDYPARHGGLCVKDEFSFPAVARYGAEASAGAWQFGSASGLEWRALSHSWA